MSGSVTARRRAWEATGVNPSTCAPDRLMRLRELCLSFPETDERLDPAEIGHSLGVEHRTQVMFLFVREVAGDQLGMKSRKGLGNPVRDGLLGQHEQRRGARGDLGAQLSDLARHRRTVPWPLQPPPQWPGQEAVPGR
jgi:hypothetical protein